MREKGPTAPISFLICHNNELPDYLAALVVKPVILSAAKPNEYIAIRA